MKVKRNNIVIVVGAGAVENAWIPILNVDGANCIKEILKICSLKVTKQIYTEMK